MSAKRKAKQQQWPHLYKRQYASGQVAHVVDLGFVDGKRERHAFKTSEEAEVFAEQARIKRQNEGMAFFSVPAEVRNDAGRSSELLKPYGVTIHQAVLEYTQALNQVKSTGLSLKDVAIQFSQAVDILKGNTVSVLDAVTYYKKHVINYQSAPVVSKIVQEMIDGAETNERRKRTVGDIRNRLEAFANAKPPKGKEETEESFKARPLFGARQLVDIKLHELKAWLGSQSWAPQTKINFMTKVSQLYNYAIKHGWVETNLVELIDRPDPDEGEPEIFTVEQAKKLLEESINFGLRPYIALGLFAGLRSAELLRLKGEAIKVEEKSIIVGADVAKKRSRRVVEMCDALISWLQPVLPIKGLVVDSAKFRENMDALKKAAGLTAWPHNALRHSFGSYHLAFHGDQVKTAQQMGHRDANVVHNHYKALVLKTEAEKFWKLCPQDSVH